ncbi:MAG: DUF2608 domain-containing protein [Puniceicoccales bacterium]|jgi:hypothetical protein|nr:DUF2608 domain-containing protein [Puniceicoccales bacterium]
MSRVLGYFIRGFALVTMLATATLFATGVDSIIYEAMNDDEACRHLGEIVPAAQDKGEILIFSDVDDTLIPGGSDTRSFVRNQNFNEMKTKNPQLVQTLREHTHIDSSISIVALTSANMWRVDDTALEQSATLDIVPIRLQDIYESPTSTLDPTMPIAEIRSSAMLSLDIPFNATLGEETHYLPFVTKDVSLLSKIFEQFLPLTLSSALQQEPYFEKHPAVFLHRNAPNSQNTSLGRELQNLLVDDFYIEETSPQPERYKQILAYPVYVNGVIFSNFFDREKGWQKGLVMHSFLLAKFGERSNWPPIAVIAIDDNLRMLQNMQTACQLLEIPFYGIHLNNPVFWIFGPPKERK